jgi:hypothetical protein
VLNAIPFDRRVRFREHVEIFEEVVKANTAGGLYTCV